MKKVLLQLLILLVSITSMAQQMQTSPNYKANDRFEQLGTVLPTPNNYRAASGSPGREYWQMRADYDIKATLDDDKKKSPAQKPLLFSTILRMS